MRDLKRPSLRLAWAAWLARQRLSTRIVAVFLALLLVLQGLVALFTGLDLRNHVSSEKEKQLGFGQVALRDVLSSHGERLATAASLAAKDHGLLEAVGGAALEHGAATVADALHTSLRRICLTELNQDRADARLVACARRSKFAAVLGPDFAPVATSGLDVDQPGRLASHLVALREQHRLGGAEAVAAAEADAIDEIALVDGQLMQFVVAAMPPQLPGWVLIGSQLDPAGLTARVRERSHADLLMLARPAQAGVAWTAPITSLAPARTRDLLVRLGTDGDAVSALAAPDGEFYARPRQVGSGGSEVWAVLLLSRQQAFAPFWQLLGSLLGVTLVGVLLFGLGGRVIARRITTPLLELARHTRKFGDGNFREAVPLLLRGDEVGTLARGMEQARQAIFKRDYVDASTDLPNARGMRELLQAQVTPAGGAGFSLLMLGIDRFDALTQALGFQAGEDLCLQVARELDGLLQAHGVHGGGAVPPTLGRWARDRFVLMLPQVGTAQAREQAGALLAAFGRRLHVRPQQGGPGGPDGPDPAGAGRLPAAAHEVDVFLRAGIACWPDHAPVAAAEAGDDQRIDSFIQRADAALFGARETTLEVVVWQAPAPSHGTPSGAEPLTLRTELQQAIAEGQLRLFLQPKCEVEGGRMIAAEALVRWQHPQRGMVQPFAFIPFAEETGLVRELTRWVFAEVARHWPALPAAGLQRVSVNLSMHDLLDEHLARDLTRVLRHQPHPVPPAGICLEITESAVMKDAEHSMLMLRRLKDAGFKLSIDDFGEGQTSLRYLRDLPVDELKIDRSLVKGVHQDRDSEAIVRFIVELAHSLKLSVVAEGVEDDAVLDALRAIGCDEAQGFHPHLGRPLPVAELLRQRSPATVAGAAKGLTQVG